MDDDEFKRLVLIGIAEMVDTLGMIAFPDMYRGFGGRAKQVADYIREAAGGGDDVQAARIRHAGSR